ncbi:MAG: tetratricopeptide repeat protein [Sedimentisphaerales bacterium]|nr:tetratricopeptide repeat protein [Sedimentisphaerales bacterium]
MTGHVRGQAFFVFSTVVCAVLLFGCHGGAVKSGGGEAVTATSGGGERAGLLAELERKFENTKVHFALGQSYRKDGLYREAEYHLDTALRFDPAHRQAQAAIVKLQTDQGEQPGAVLRAKQFIDQVDVSYKETMKLAAAFEGESCPEYALACYRQAVKLSPESAEPHRKIGYYYLNNSDEETAKEYFKQSFRLDPRQSEVAGELGRLGVIVRVPRDPLDTGRPG